MRARGEQGTGSSIVGESSGIAPGRRARTDHFRAKLAVGHADDPLEREADAIAERVVSGGGGGAITATSAPMAVSRAGGASGGDAPAQVEDAVGGGGGAALDGATRARMEQGFGRDLGHVRVHESDAAARSIGARAFTAGNDIHFASGQLQPETRDGQFLIAHEIAHTVQHGGGGEVRRKAQPAVDDNQRIDDDAFITALDYFAKPGFIAYSQVPERYPIETAAVDTVAEQVRQVIVTLVGDAPGKVALAVEQWGAVRPSCDALLARAARDGIAPDRIALGRRAMNQLDADIAPRRAQELIDQRQASMDMASPEAGFYQAADVTMKSALDKVDALYKQATSSFVSMNGGVIDKGPGKDGLTASYAGFSFAYTLFHDVGNIPEKLKKAKEHGIVAVTATFVDLLRYGVQMCGNVVSAIGSIGQSLARAQGLKEAEQQFASLTSRVDNKMTIFGSQGPSRIPAGAILGGIAGLLGVVSGTLSLIDALKRGDDHAALAAGGAIAQGLIGIGGAVLSAMPGTAAIAGITGPLGMTVAVWVATIDGLMTLAEAIGEMKRERKLRAVGLLVDQSAQVAQHGLKMAAAAQEGFLGLEGGAAKDPQMDAMIRARAQEVAISEAGQIKTNLAALASEFRPGNLDTVGGYPDLVDRLGPNARQLLDGGAHDDAITLTGECSVIFGAIDRLARYALAAEGPDAGKPDANRTMREIDAQLDDERKPH